MQELTDTYMTIEGKAQGLFKEKGSRFIALAYPVSSEEEVKDILANLKKEYYDARHHCYAYVLGFKGEIWRANDDGEPSSTAGKPIHGQIVSRSLTNTLVVVIRYFGGTKLGVSGLINAYKTSASDALDNAVVITKKVKDVFLVKFPYLVMNDIMKLVKDEELDILNQQFDMNCEMLLGVQQAKSSHFLEKFGKIESSTVDYVRTE